MPLQSGPKSRQFSEAHAFESNSITSATNPDSPVSPISPSSTSCHHRPPATHSHHFALHTDIFSEKVWCICQPALTHLPLLVYTKRFWCIRKLWCIRPPAPCCFSGAGGGGRYTPKFSESFCRSMSFHFLHCKLTLWQLVWCIALHPKLCRSRRLGLAWLGLAGQVCLPGKKA